MRFVLAGNPNSGKTTLFNNLTGSSAHVGNWPGVTVERKEGVYRAATGPVTISDLPGIYSLSPYSPEEIVSRDAIIEGKPDLIINIVDATNLERNLYLTTQLMETDCPLVIALNMMDVVEKEGYSIDAEALERELGVPVAPISALDSGGTRDLMDKAMALASQNAKNSQKPGKGRSVLSASPIGPELSRAVSMLEGEGVEHPIFHAVKLIEGDELERKELEVRFPPDAAKRIESAIDDLKRKACLPEDVKGDFEAAIADLRYRFITERLRGVISGRKTGGLTTSDKIDMVLTNKYAGIPIFLAVMFFVFHLIFSDALFGTDMPSPGVWLQDLTSQVMDAVTAFAGEFLEGVGASELARGVVIGGIFAGVGAVLSFLPQIMMLFLFLSILEDSGYMARAAFLMDRVLRCFGLSGKSFLPMLMGFGCSVPAMMATRTLEDQRDRRATIMLMPFFSCGAKAPIWAMFAAALFPKRGDVMIFGVYIIGIVTAIAAGVLLKMLVFRKDAVPFIMELPAYHMPRAKNVALELWNKLRSFIMRASTLIAGATVVIWFLSNFSVSLDSVDPGSAESILGTLGTLLRPLFEPLGFASGEDGWKAVVAILTGLIAKEMVVSTMGVLYAGGDALSDEAAGAALTASLAAAFSPSAALSFMAFNLLSVPCMAAVATARGEMKSSRWTWFTIFFWIMTAWVVSLVIFKTGTLFETMLG